MTRKFEQRCVPNKVCRRLTLGARELVPRGAGGKGRPQGQQGWLTTLTAMTIIRYEPAADTEHIAPHAAVMAVAVPSAMNRCYRSVIDALKARQGGLRWSSLAARRAGKCEARCDGDGA